MKNIFCAALFLFLVKAIPADAQSVDQWRLVKKTWLLPGDAADIYEYKYDATGRVSEIWNLSGKTLKNTEKNFVYDGNGRISRSSLYIQGKKLYTYEFGYDAQGRLISRNEITHDVNYGKPDKVTLTRNFRHENNRIVESKSRSSFGGKLADEIVHELDGKGDFLRKQGKTEAYTYGNYDSRLNPLQFTGAYFFTDLQSLHAGGDGAWEGTPSATSRFTANKDGLLGKMTVTYTTSDGGKVNHTYEYTYVKIK